MRDLSTSYLGLPLRTPLIVGSCGLTNTVESIQSFAENGAGAVVLKSLFEEQIAAEFAHNLDQYQADYPEAFDYIRGYTRTSALDEYLDLIAAAKNAVDIPIIASINCLSAKEWMAFAASVQKAGAAAIELNISFLPSDPNLTCAAIEKQYFDIVHQVSDLISIPVALKMSPYAPALANLISRLSWTGKVAGFVLFNRHYRPDIALEQMQVTQADMFSTAGDMIEPLRWIALLSARIERDFAASTGVHDGSGLIKQILAGAAAVQVVSTLYKNGAGQLTRMLKELESWMNERGYERLADFRGALSHRPVGNPAAFERIQFMKQFGGMA
ncbi:dihydroorotate dehydrogenase-like protein [Desulfobulbus elongatus]|uniref:dihydroorotate dehydrogenase-like protein n=1 Tax=Desulfobulbus elongatus TaxID=53332 RepID=UPI00048596B4|nr:dihydroorotate dehydrogenase-like protein [Desulfobulbus elongatus]